ncbi:MAG: ribonuclease H-like domain-containing protein [Lachnospiraceae bacterium]|nr:ribonuclease H-like domain-containing protein [Lachnospiraceae bacterium]
MYVKDEIIDDLFFERSARAVCSSADPRDVIFFDIETTGLSPSRSGLYMIGCLFIDGDHAVLRQFFADDREDEKKALDSFSKLLETRSRIVHFNGSTFDVPYMKTKYEQHGSDDPFSGKKGFDLYRILMPLKRILSLESMKQKALEELCGLYREDRYTGGELIKLYKEYQKKVLLNRTIGAEEEPGEITDMRRVLFLHNRDDMKGMLTISNLIGIVSFVSGGFSVTGSQPCEDGLTVFIRPEREMPEWALKGKSFLNLFDHAQNGGLRIDLQYVKGRMRLFMKDFRDHYYIPSQDMAVHVSVADFMGSHDKKRATPATCYVPCEGTFLTIDEKDLPEGFPVIKREYTDRVVSVRAQDVTNEVLKAAVMHMIQRNKDNRCT